jgi:natural product precursor
MRTIKLKLGQLNRDSVSQEQLDQIKGGTYCNFGWANQVANQDSGKCSCFCHLGYDYYGQYGISVNASYCKEL